MRCDASYIHFPAAKVDEKEHGVRHQPTQCPDLGGEEVRRDQDVEMRADELLPRGGCLPLWSRWDAMALEDIAHGLVTHGVSPVGQGSHDTVIAPRAIFLGHAHHQGLDLLVDRGTARGFSLGGTVKLRGHELAMPAG